MLFRRRPPQIDTRPIQPAEGFDHLAAEAVAVLKWLKANQVEFVLVGPVAEAMRDGAASPGPVAIVPAPYRRNHERLSRALDAAHARPRPEGGARESREAVAAKAIAERSGAGERWVLGTGAHYLDVEGRPSGTPGYQELLYESTRFEPATGMAVDVASPEDIEHYAHVRRTGTSPEIRVMRGVPQESAVNPT
ncbi:MAG TPA: hypothetical protein VMF57_01520 [Solirubrobacteraceae bacterium]|nr:hypothetical protein [Solirubrobacteraceae bacterium]